MESLSLKEKKLNLEMKKNSRVGLIFHYLDKRTLSFLKILLASCFIGLCAQVKIPLFFTPVPLTIQTPAVMLMGALLGSRRGMLAVLIYLMQGFIGLPVWSGGSSGLNYFMGPTGGYLIGFMALAFIAGKCAEKQKKVNFMKVLALLLLGVMLQLSIGSLWLAQYVGLDNCLKLGFYPFVFVEVVKASFLASSFRLGRQFLPTT